MREIGNMVEATVGSARWVRESINPVWVEARKKFDDAIYRTKTGDTTTADQLWDELKEAQETTTDGLVAGLQCMGIMNQLQRRGQIPTPQPKYRAGKI